MAYGSSTLTTSCGFSKQALIGVVIAGVVFVIMCYLRCRQPRPRRAVRLSQVPLDGTGRQSSYPPKPYNAPAVGGYLPYYQATPPAPLPVPMPQYPPRGYDTCHNYSASQSTARTIPEPIAPTRAPSSVISRPISSHDTTSHSLRSSVRRGDPIAIVPLSPSSPPPRSPSVAIPPASAPSPRPSGAIQLPSAARPFALSPIHTGISNNIDEPPPAYTPV
ncbi:hypothetical protein J3R82DRAFT_3064 [Butyriboletus roseoflavus]|nr:hypothetical protein J3R82DRAFT_3064 [Butyriboletus roseoflavus]